MRAGARIALVVVLGSLALVACGRRGGGVIRRAAVEMNCPADDIDATPIGAGGWMVEGCGRRMTYSCAGFVCVPVTAGGESVASAPPSGASRVVVQDSTAPTTSSGRVAESWSDEAVGRALGPMRAQIVACGTPPFRVALAVDRHGAIAVRGGASTPAAACVATLVAPIDLDGVAIRARSVTLEVGSATTWRLISERDPAAIQSGIERIDGPLLRCFASAHLPATAVLTFSPEGRISAGRWEHEVVLTESQCAQTLFASVDLAGAVELGAVVRLHVSAAGVTTEILDVSDEPAAIAAPPTTTAPSTSPIRPAPPATAGLDGPGLRAALDAHAAAILACTGGTAVALSLTWDASGTVTVAVRGSHDAAETECVRAALPSLHAAGAAGTLLHAVSP